MTTLEQQAGNGIRPFTVQIPKDALDDLRRRLAATRWPTRELVGDWSQGVQLATMQALLQYWATEYDGRRVESRLNARARHIERTAAFRCTGGSGSAVGSGWSGRLTGGRA